MNDLLPSNWVYESIDRLSAPHKGAIKIGPFGSALSKKEMVSSGIKVYGQEHVYKKDFSIGNYFITEEKYQKLKTCTLERGDVVVTMMGTVGASTVVPDDADVGVMDSHLLRIQVDEKRVWSHLLSMQLRDSQDVKDQIRKMSQGGIMSGLNAAIVKSIRVPLPPLQEQQKIAAILTSVDDVIEKTQAQINKLKDLKTGMMQELLTRGVGVDGKPHTEFKDSPVGRIPKGWDVVNVGSLVEVIDPQPDHRTPPEVENGIPYVGLGDIDKSGVINFSSARKVSEAAFDKQCRSFDIHKGAFIFGKIGTIGNPSILPNNRFYCLSANVILITCSDIDLLMFIYQIFTSELINEQVKQQTNTTSQPALGIKKVRDFLVPYPSKEEMRALVNTLISIDQRIAKLDLKFAKYKLNKKALMQDLLTGKVRVNVN